MVRPLEDLGFAGQLRGEMAPLPVIGAPQMMPGQSDPLAELRAQSDAMKGGMPAPGAPPAMVAPPVDPGMARLEALHRPTQVMPPEGQMVAQGQPPASAVAPSSAVPGVPGGGLPRAPGTGGGGFASELAGASKQAIGAEHERAALAQKQADEQNALQQKMQVQREAVGQEWQQKWQNNQAQGDRLQQEIASGKIDPKAWWKNRDLGGKVASSIALVLGGIGQAFGGGENPALKVIQSNIQRDIDAQEKDLGKKQNLLSHYVQQGHDLQNAKRLAMADMQDAYAGQMQMVATKYAGPEAKVNAEKAIAGIKQNTVKERQEVAQRGFENQIKLMHAEAAMMAAGAKGQGGHQVPAKEAAEVGGLKSASDMLDVLMKTRGKKTGAFSGAMQYVPGTDAAQYTDAQKAAAQTVGLILEGGKLAEGDLGRYMDLMPSAGDSDSRAKAKVENVKKLLALKGSNQVQALERAGYNAGGLEAIAQPPVERVAVVGPKGERGTIDAKDLSKYPGWRPLAP